MLDQIIQVAVGTGLMATLFVTLFAYVLKDSHAREQKYQEIIDKLNDEILKGINEVKEKVKKK